VTYSEVRKLPFENEVMELSDRDTGALWALKEQIYQESYELELGFRSIEFIPKGELQLYYKGHLSEKKYYPDLLVSGEIITELKAVKALNAEHERQLLNYMRITKKAVGYLVNFGPLEKLEWKRFILREYVPNQQ